MKLTLSNMKTTEFASVVFCIETSKRLKSFKFMKPKIQVLLTANRDHPLRIFLAQRAFHPNIVQKIQANLLIVTMVPD